MQLKRPVISLLLSIGLVLPAMAAPPATITYQGYLTAESGAPVMTPVAMTFSLYADSTGGSAIWSEFHPSEVVSNGNYSVLLGTITPISLPFNTVYYLGVAIGSNPEMVPRQVLSSVPSAFHSLTADKLGQVCGDGEALKYVASSTSWSCAPWPDALTGATGSQGLTGSAGAQGVPGVQGVAGINGLDGNTVRNSTINPNAGIGVDGDFYINTSSSTIFGPKVAGAWPNGIALIGPTGIPGIPGNPGGQGPIGPTGLTGASGSQGLTGSTGPQGVQGNTGTNGTNGLDGKTVRNGTTDPVAGVGIDGDFYINTISSAIFGPKIAGVWPNGITLVGQTGTVGAIGAAGATGPQGPIGLTGLTGATGSQGLAGSTGPRGSQGPIGLTGLTGATGTQGLTGSIGQQGVQGAQGVAGTNGLDGKTVRNGITNPDSGIGVDGDFYINTTSSQIFGPKVTGAWPNGISLVGQTGAAGASGAVGATGPQGSIGLTGFTGATGTQGLAGSIGPQGSQGSTGLTGATGSQGLQGPIGPTGLTGATGSQGLTGSTGPQGVAGTNGTNGLDGKTVLNGTTDPGVGAGVDGDFYINTTSSLIFGPKTAGTWPNGITLVGSNGATGAAGPQGAAGATGLAGLQGPMGLTGATGPQGVAGTSGTQGADGKTVHNGTVDPDGTVGVDGDFYVNTVTNMFFGPKILSTWPTGIKLGLTTPTLYKPANFNASASWQYGLSTVATNVTVLTSGNYTVPSGVYFITIEAIGGGGGGAGAACSIYDYCSTSGSGGGAGEYAGTYLAVTPGSTVSIAYGAAGTAGNKTSSSCTYSACDAGVGGDTVVTYNSIVYLTAHGGRGGYYSQNGVNPYAGVGGTGSIDLQHKDGNSTGGSGPFPTNVLINTGGRGAVTGSLATAGSAGSLAISYR